MLSNYGKQDIFFMDTNKQENERDPFSHMIRAISLCNTTKKDKKEKNTKIEYDNINRVLCNFFM